MKRTLLSIVIALSICNQLHAQTCTATTYNVDFSASVDTSVVIQSTRNGDCCGGTNCIRFDLTINPACSYVNFTVENPAPPGNAAYYQVNCGPQTSLGTPICVVGLTHVTITFCKPGNDNPIYTIVAAGALQGSGDITVREGCTGSMSVAGLTLGTINWTSIYPGAQGAYDSYLSCTSACTSTNVTPLQGAPAYIDYKVSGYRLCGPIVNDTIRVYTTPQIAVAVTPATSTICAGSSTTLTATASGGDVPYNYLWSTGETGPSITVNTGGVFTVSVTDIHNCLPAVQSATVSIAPVPNAPTVTSNSPVCDGGTLNLFASSVSGATYSWTGPNGFTSSSQNPVINNVNAANAGSYAVTVTVGQCTSTSITTSVVINLIPATPVVSTSPVCEGMNLNLTASLIPGASYSWTGPNNFSSSNQNPTITNAGSINAGIYSVTVTTNGCTSTPASVNAVVNMLPSAPIVSTNSPLCSGSSINLMAGTMTGASYSWTGPNGFTSSLQNPTITNASTNASGSYSVTATMNGCTGAAGTALITVNQIPLSPSVSSNGPLCAGSTLNLTASTITGASYAWSGPNGFTSLLQNPVINNVTAAHAGSYAVTVTVAQCTSASAIIPVVINSIPATPVVSASPVCEGMNLNLTASLIPGASYSWSGPNNFSSSNQNPTITNAGLINAGTYSVTATANGCTSTPASVSAIVNTVPSAPIVSTNSPLCSGSSIHLMAGTVSGASYSWTGPNGFTSSLQNPVINNVTAANAGSYAVTVTVGQCTSTSTTTSIVINSIPATPVVSTSPVCEGMNLNLTASLIPGASYSWTGPNNFSSSNQNPVINNAGSINAGTYSVTVTANGCTSTPTSVNAVVNLLPLAPIVSTNSPLCSGSSINLMAGAMTGASYSWTGPNGFTSSLQNPTITNASTNASGSYSVTATVNGCTGAAGTALITVNQIPLSPSVSSNGPLCAGSTLNLTASTIAGASYAWSGPNGFTSSLQNPVINNVTAAHAGPYAVTVTVSQCTSASATTSVIINSIPATPVVSASPVCEGMNLNLTASLIPGASYSWSGPNNFSSSNQNPTITNAGLINAGTYSVTATANGCTSTPASVSAIVNTVPSAPIVSTNSPLCSGSSIRLLAGTVSGASYSWTGPNGFTSSLQNPVINNVTAANAGSYAVTVTVGQCTSTSAITSVVINPIPATPVVSTSPVCEGMNLNLTASLIPGASYSWTGPNNFSSSNQNPIIINAVLINAGTYTVAVTANGCTSTPASVNAVVNMLPSAPNVSTNSPICSGSSINLMAGAMAGATYSWTGPNGFSSSFQNPTITNAGTNASGSYSVTATVNGCTGAAGIALITVNQIPPSPSVSSNGPLCAGSTVNLTASTIAGASYSWSGPNGFTSSLQNPVINNATPVSAGIYNARATVNGCTSPAMNTTIVINQPAIANAGNNQVVCSLNQFVNLAGSLSGGTGSAVWTSSGSGNFSPGNSSLNTNYYPSATDRSAGSVMLNLTSTNNGACPASSSSVKITFAAAPSVNAGSDQTVCANNANVFLKGQYNNAAGIIWSSSGNGTFSPSSYNLNATYIPSTGDKSNGRVNLILKTTGNTACTSAADTILVTIKAAPVINSGGVKYVLENNSTTLTPAISGSNLKYLWTPGIYLNSDTLPNPVCTPKVDVSYKIISIDNFGCSSSADVFVKVLKPLQIPNVFTPNGDGINEKWEVKNLKDYADCEVEIFNRYGQIVYRSVGYSNEWDGTLKGKPLPAATYYYIINLKIAAKPLSGFVDIVR